MRNLKLTLAYDGTEFHGWQIQPNLPTVQGTLQSALEKLFNHSVTVTGSGRTDAGVHAQGQVANVETIRSIDTDATLRGLNALLPSTIRVWQVEEVASDFHSRHSASSKTYEYHIWRQHIVSPFHCRYVYAFPYAMNAIAMDEATACFLGNHDFTSFCATASEAENRVRTIFEAEWQRGAEEWVFKVRGNGFLQYMVRTIVGTLVYVGTGKFSPQDVVTILEAKDRKQAGPCVPAQGLHLIRVDY
jgi:tRNA pseudouridine38-40 synthase